METGFRYRMEHLGDYFVGMVDKVSEAARCSAKGVILTYDIHFLKKKKRGLVNDLGARVAALRKTDPEQVIFADEKVREILTTLDETEKRYDEFIAERQSRLYPSSCMCTCTQEQTPAQEEEHIHEKPHTHEELHTHDEPHTHEEEHIYDEHHTHEEAQVQEEFHEEPHVSEELHTQEEANEEPHTHEAITEANAEEDTWEKTEDESGQAD
ncbi:MAG: hypothetical protein HQK99_04790 [Nitrospirae bacterium]|nr:hypothetical protein [Nitrospirota bacterium]